MSTLHRTSFKDHSGDFCGAQRVCRRCQVLSGLLIWRETHVPFKGPLLFQPFAVVIVEHSNYTFNGHRCHKRQQLKINFCWRPSFFGQKASEPCSEPTGTGAARRTFNRSHLSAPIKAPPSTDVTDPKVSPCAFFYLFIYLFLPSFAGMHHAPGNARLQTHVHATSRTPQLHQRGCMAHPKNKKRVGGGGERVFLNNSSFGQHRAGCRGETICVVTRPLGEKRAHTMRRLEEGTEELSALRVWGRRAARRGGAE